MSSALSFLCALLLCMGRTARLTLSGRRPVCGKEAREGPGGWPRAARSVRCSAQVFKEALTLLPGGVNSPVRAFKSVGGQPIIFDHVSGPYCFDVDGNQVRRPYSVVLVPL